MKLTSDFSHYFQSLGHLNVVPTDHQRVIGSPAPAAIRKMNEKHRKKKLVSHNEIICTEYSDPIWQMCIGLSLMVLKLPGPLQFWWIPLDYPLRLRRRRQRRWRRRWSLHDTKGHCPRRWRGKNCSMINLFAKRHPLYMIQRSVYQPNIKFNLAALYIFGMGLDPECQTWLIICQNIA